MKIFKKFSAVLLSLMMLFSTFSVTAIHTNAAQESNISEFEFSAPEAPNYFIYTDGDASVGQHDDLLMFMVVDPEVSQLAAEFYNDSDAFYAKYGLYYFNIVMQYDVSLDNEENWQYTEEWDTTPWIGGYGDGFQYVSISDQMVDDFEFFWLTYHEGQGGSTFIPYQPAIITEIHSDYGYEENIYSFDTENHSLYIRCRYYMEWEPLVQYEEGEGPGEKQSKFSDWSESAVFGRNSTQIIPDEPTVYEAPIISALKFVSNEYGTFDLEYVQTTPESVWLANIYYKMFGDGYFDGLETQVSIEDGEWQTFDTADSWGDWCLSNGNRIAFNYDVPFEEDTNMKLRIRFMGTHGPSEWSNVLEVNSGEAPETYSITVINGTASKTTATAGEIITLTADTPPSGKEFDKWIVTGAVVSDENSNSTAFTMPANNVTVTATYKDVVIPTYSVTVTNGTASPKTATAGEIITLTAKTPAFNKKFDKWVVTGTTVEDETSAVTTFTMPASNVTAVATYKDVVEEEIPKLSGDVTSYLSETDDITITLRKVSSEEIDYQTIVQGNNTTYSFEDVIEGDYILTVSKNNHVTREYEITIGDDALTQDVKIHPLGDVTGDGKINTIDVARANAHAKGVAVLGDYEFKCANVNSKDNKVNTIDVAKINAHAKGVSML
ncbi:MAG: dockerin type I repeat-containing protein [Clostridia bacterium]|nr:dockerin type I repeat-containing protein [Clostridia bacterium]